MWKQVGAETHASTAAPPQRHGRAETPGRAGHGVPAAPRSWPSGGQKGQHPLAWTCLHSQLLPLPLPHAALTPRARLSCPAPRPEPTGRPRWTTALCGVRLLLKYPEAGVCTQPSLPTCGKQTEMARRCLQLGTATSQQPSCAAHKASRTRSPVLAQKLAMWPWASLLKPLSLQQQCPGLQRCQLEPCEPGLFTLCSNLPLWHGEYGN